MLNRSLINSSKVMLYSVTRAGHSCAPQLTSPLAFRLSELQEHWRQPATQLQARYDAPPHSHPFALLAAPHCCRVPAEEPATLQLVVVVVVVMLYWEGWSQGNLAGHLGSLLHQCQMH
jgi:hypothetical protein